MNIVNKKLISLFIPKNISKNVHTNASLIEKCTEINNRNPRNLELLRIARKPSGYHLERITREYWHRLVLDRSVKHVTISVEHFENGTVVSASTKELSIKKRLYKLHDSSAYLNLGRILAQRCIESGILFVHNDPKQIECNKYNLILQELENNGIILTEPSRFKKANPWDLERPDKPWEILE